MRTVLRVALAITLLMGGEAGMWTPTQAPECCCGPVAAQVEDRCPCPQPEGNRGPNRGVGVERTTLVAAPSAPRKKEQAAPRLEPRPEPLGWEAAPASRGQSHEPCVPRGRDPDLGRHLARLHTLLI